MNRKIGIAALIGLLFAGFIGFYMGRYSERLTSVENTKVQLISAPSPTVKPSSAPTVTATTQPMTSTPTPVQPPIERTMSQGFFSLKSDIDANDEFNGPLHFLATADHRYEVIDSKNDKVQINFNGLKGWIPAWYLKKDNDETKVIEVKPYIMIVNNPTKVLSYPADPAPTGNEFKAGKVVRIYKEYGEWVAVNFINYAEPNFGDYWVLKKDLMAWDPKKAKEGKLKAGTSKKYADMQENTNIQINKDGNDSYEVNSYGGVFREIDKKDFVPNPFIDRPVAPRSPLVLIDDLELSPEQEKIFTSYALNRLDSRLQGLSAADIFKFYLEATIRKDQETKYGLYRQGNGYGTPSYESFVEDLKLDPSMADTAITAWGKLKQNNTFVVQENYMEDNHAVVYIIPLDKAAEMKNFQLYETKEGIWKVSWMPLQ